MSLKLMIRIAANTEGPALTVLRNMGYALWVEPGDEESDGLTDYQAEKDGRRFSADTPVTLLGLVAMHEARGDDWHSKASEPNIRDELFEAAYPDDTA